MILTDKQAAFIREYLIDLNATQAAIRAGYSAKTAKQAGARLLTNAAVKAAISDAQEERADRLEVTVDRIEQELAKIGFANMRNYVRVTSDGDPFVDLSNLNEAQAAAISEVTVEDFTEGRGDDARDVRRVKFKLHDKRAALVDLGRRHGMFVDRHEIVDKTPQTERSNDERARVVLYVIETSFINRIRQGDADAYDSAVQFAKDFIDKIRDARDWANSTARKD